MTPNQALDTCHPNTLATRGNVDQPTLDLIGGWLLEHPSANTRTAYAKDLRLLVDWLAQYDVPLLAATRPQIAAWAESMRRGERPLSESTIRRRLATASSFFGYAVTEDAIAANPVTHVRRPKVDVDEDTTPWLDETGMRALIAQAAAYSPRAHALVAVMLTTGARVSEALAADVTDLGHTGGHRVLTVTRKGGRRQHLPLAPWVGVAVDAYLDGRLTGPLFATKAHHGGHGRLDETAVWRLIRRLAVRAGVPGGEQIHPHSLRHSAITGALDGGAPLREVQAMAGHRHPGTTARYDRARGRLDRSPVYTLAAALAPR